MMNRIVGVAMVLLATFLFAITCEAANNAVIFDGTSQYGKLNNFSDINDMTDGNSTVELWFYQDSSGCPTYGTFFSLYGISNERAWGGTENATCSTGLNFRWKYVTTNADGYANGAFSNGAWVHYAFVSQLDQKTKIFINGSEISYALQQTPSGDEASTTAADFYIGDSPSTSYFKGKIGGYVRLWNTVRSSAQINAEKNKTLVTSNEPGLIINLLFTEGSGTTIENEASTTNNMTLTGAPSWETSDLPTLSAKDYTGVNGIGIDSSSSNSPGELAVTTTDWVHEVAQGISNRIVIVGTACRDTTSQADRVVSGVTYGGNAMTVIRQDDENSLRYISSSLWYYLNPSVGTATVEITFAGEVQKAVGGAITLNGVNQSDPIDSNNGGSGGSTTGGGTTTATTIGNAYLVESTYCAVNDPMAVASGQTRYVDFELGDDQFGQAYYAATSTATYPMLWTWTSGSGEGWVQSIVSLTPATSTPATTVITPELWWE